MTDYNRRTTLGPVSFSSMNARSGSASRQSLGPQGIATVKPSTTTTKSVSINSNAVDMEPSRRFSTAVNPPRMSLGGANLAGPSRRQSIGAAPSRKSSVQPRNSSAGGGILMSSRPVADPRNLSDKTFMISCMKTLVEYLNGHGFGHAMSSKTLMRPSVKDFQNIVMFLFQQVDPNFTSTGKLEDEVVTMFKYLGYPYTIQKSHIASAGSPHAWPSLLVSLVWLVELLMYDKEAAIAAPVPLPIDPDYEGEGIEDITTSDRAFFEFLSRAYLLFLAGQDAQYENFEGSFLGTYEDRNKSLQRAIDIEEQSNEGLKLEIEDVERRITYLPELQKTKADYMRDLSKFEHLIEQLSKHKSQLGVKTELRTAELEKLSNSIALLQQDCEELQERIANQELSPEDVKNILAEKERLESEQQVASDHRQTLQRTIWETETVLRDKYQALEHTTKKYNSVAENLKLVPATARNAGGRVLSIDVDTKAKKRSAILKSDIRNEIVPFLQQCQSDIAQSTAEFKHEIIVEQDVNEELEGKLHALEEQRQDLEQRLKRMDENYRREKERLDSAVESHRNEMDKIEGNLMKMRDITSDESRFAAANRRLKECRSLREIRREEHERSKREIAEEILDVVSTAASLRENLQIQLGGVKQAYSDKLNSLLMENNQYSNNHHAPTHSNNRYSILAPPYNAVNPIPSVGPNTVNKNHFSMAHSDFNHQYQQQQQAGGLPQVPQTSEYSMNMRPPQGVPQFNNYLASSVKKAIQSNKSPNMSTIMSMANAEHDFDAMDISPAANDPGMYSHGNSQSRSAKKLVGTMSDMSPIVRQTDEHGLHSGERSMAIDSENAAFIANISRAMIREPAHAPSRLVFNLSGLINECAKQDHNLLDESYSPGENGTMELQEL